MIPAGNRWLVQDEVGCMSSGRVCTLCGGPINTVDRVRWQKYTRLALKLGAAERAEIACGDACLREMPALRRWVRGVRAPDDVASLVRYLKVAR